MIALERRIIATTLHSNTKLLRPPLIIAARAALDYCQSNRIQGWFRQAFGHRTTRAAGQVQVGWGLWGFWDVVPSNLTLPDHHACDRETFSACPPNSFTEDHVPEKLGALCGLVLLS